MPFNFAETFGYEVCFLGFFEQKEQTIEGVE